MTEIWIVLLSLVLGQNPVGRDQAKQNNPAGSRDAQWYVFKSSVEASNFIQLIKPSSSTFTVIRGFEQDVTANIRFEDKR